MRCIAVPLAAAALASACDEGPPRRLCGGAEQVPSAFTLRDDGIEVEIQSAPYALEVRDAGGEVVLESAPGADDEGYAPLSWTTGLTSYDKTLTPGWTSFLATLDPWRSGFRVVAAAQDSDRLSVTLADPEAPRAPCLEVEHEIRRSAVRVTARRPAGAPRAWSAAFGAGESEGFLGFGERFNETDQRGKNVWSWAEEGGIGTGEGTEAGPDNPTPNGEMMTYYPVPFFLSTEGYGFWLDTTYRSEFELASAREGAWRAWHVGPEMSFEVYLPLRDDERPWPYQVIDLFTEATGRPMLPPDWTFGPRRRISRDDVQRGLSEIERMRQLDLAITALDDAMHFFPSGHHQGIEEELAAWVAEAEALGYRVNGYYNSFVDWSDDSGHREMAEEKAELGYFLENADGTHPDLYILTGGDVPELYLVDFTNPEASEWYQSTFDWAIDLGYAGWMYDFGEYVPGDDVVAYDGTPGEALHNLYPVQYARAVHEALESGPRAGDWLAFMRSGYTGSSAYVPMVWSGDPAASFEDSDGLPSMVRAGVNLGVSGAPHFGGDIGGFHCHIDGTGAADEELLVRWIQQGSMSSNMQHQDACVGGNEPQKASIWNSDAVREAWRVYARLHTRLFPYLYTLAHEASATGAPTMRHVFLEHPDRPDLSSVDDAYYLGPALFVAPVVERGARQKTVQLPEGLYLDWADEALVEGGREVTLDAPLDKLPLLLRAGHLVPLLDPAIDTLAEESHPEIVGADDVASVYDVVGLLGPEAPTARFALYRGGLLSATLDGELAPPALPEASGEEELSSCEACYLVTELGGGLRRVRVTAPEGVVLAGGLTLTNESGRRVRWDLYLAP